MDAPTRQELIDALTKQGVTLSGEETDDQLKQLVVDFAETIPNVPEAPEAEVTIEARAPGMVVKEYFQNGLKYKRVIQENGGTLDMRA